MKFVTDEGICFWDQFVKKNHRGLKNESYFNTKVSNYSKLVSQQYSSLAIEITYIFMSEGNNFYSEVVDLDYSKSIGYKADYVPSNRDKNQSTVMKIDLLTFICNSLISLLKMNLDLCGIGPYSVWALSIEGTN